MSNEQTVVIPEYCLGCHAKRLGIQEGVYFFSCGTTITPSKHPKGRLHIRRTQRCIEDQGRAARR